jgi:SEC-C motif-containing protein
MKINCYCNSNKLFSECCEPYILGIQKAPTAKELMASRYSAYCIHDVNYLMGTTHISTRKFHNKNETLDFATKNQWVKLEIINFSEAIVEFKAYYIDENNNNQIHHEKSKFRKEEGNWFYVDGEWY